MVGQTVTEYRAGRCDRATPSVEMRRICDFAAFRSTTRRDSIGLPGVPGHDGALGLITGAEHVPSSTLRR